MVRYPGKARDLARYVFGETIVDAGGVILFVKYELCCQIATHSLKNHGGSFTRVQPKKMVIEVNKEAVIGIWP